MKVAVGSKNPVKLNAVKSVFRKFYRGAKVFGVAVESGVSKQPIGARETIRGAKNRALAAFRQSKADLGVGIEAGLVRFGARFLDVQFCAIADEKRVTLGCGPGFEYPGFVIKEVVKGKEIEEVVEKISGIKNIGEGVGAVGFLSRGVTNRTKLTEQCVLMALLPRINEELYLDSNR